MQTTQVQKQTQKSQHTRADRHTIKYVYYRLGYTYTHLNATAWKSDYNQFNASACFYLRISIIVGSFLGQICLQQFIAHFWKSYIVKELVMDGIQ